MSWNLPVSLLSGEKMANMLLGSSMASLQLIHGLCVAITKVNASCILNLVLHIINNIVDKEPCSACESFVLVERHLQLLVLLTGDHPLLPPVTNTAPVPLVPVIVPHVGYLVRVRSYCPK